LKDPPVIADDFQTRVVKSLSNTQEHQETSRQEISEQRCVVSNGITEEFEAVEERVSNISTLADRTPSKGKCSQCKWKEE
jgi:hypothetical protein